MATLDSPTTPTVSVAVDNQNAGRVSIRHLDHTSLVGTSQKVLGHYRVFTIGATGAIATGLQGFLRYIGPNVLVIHRVYAVVSVVTAVTGQATSPLQCFVARSYTVADTTAATAVTLKGADQAMRSNMGPIGANVQIYNATASATVCSGGTSTVDDNAFGALGLSGVVALGTTDQGDLYKWDQMGMHPLVLQQNEGIQMKWGTTLATGTAALGIGFEFAEVAAY